MGRLVVINLALLGMTAIAIADQPISDYFASNTFVTQKFINAMDSPRSLAVMDFEAVGLDSTLAAGIAENFRGEMFNTGNFRVVPANVQQEQLAAQGFKPGACNTIDCLMAAGTILTVDYIAGGSVSLTDSIYNLSVTLVNVGSGETVKTASYRAVNDLANLTDAGVRAVAAELAAQPAPAIETPPAPQQPVQIGEGPAAGQSSLDDLFESSLTGDIYGFEPKSTKRAFFYSLLVPGAGEYYAGSKIKPFVFVGVEALIWGSYLAYHNKGNDKRDEYRQYAQDHYQWWDFMQWWNTLPPISEPGIVGQDTFSHRMPWDDDNNRPNFNHEYYENVGKYDQFQLGWDDIDDYPPPFGPSVISPHRNTYLNLRQDANSLYKTADLMIMLSLGNHILSAFDAALSAKNYNKGERRYSIKLKAKDWAGENVPMLTYTYRF